MGDKKRMALFLDGTWNNVSDNTTMAIEIPVMKSLPNNSSITVLASEHNLASVFQGECSAFGINEEVINAYEWLVENYEQDAQLFIFGFSRGAFTARSRAGFISKCGLLKPGSPCRFHATV